VRTAGTDLAYRQTYVPGVRSAADASVVALSPGENRAGVDVTAPLVPAVRVSGRLEGAEAGPNRGRLFVRLLAKGDEMLGYGSEVALTFIDDAGTFAFDRVPAGVYTLVAGARLGRFVDGSTTSRGTDGLEFTTRALTPVSGYASLVSISPVEGSRPTFSSFAGRADVTVGETAVEGIIIPLRPTVAIIGTIRMQSSEPLPRPTGSGLFNVGPSIVAEPADGSPSLAVSAHDNIRVPGASSFEVHELLPGEYVLRIRYPFDRPERWCCAVVRSITWQGTDYTDRPFDASAGHDFDDVVVTLDEPATIRGVVRNAAGEPVPDRIVVFFPADRSRWERQGINPRGFGTALVNTDGTFSLGQVPGGEYYVAAIGSEGEDQSWRSPEFLERAAAAATRVRAEWGAHVTMDLTAR
jgi:hypothetical protein